MVTTGFLSEEGSCTADSMDSSLKGSDGCSLKISPSCSRSQPRPGVSIPPEDTPLNACRRRLNLK
ncbi:hypothetical protein EYF80_016312 [Liparis tanakae]|uniref:Uncharacterized protein n=1 Tax=Liparis tanakae TaxID=230148 RepID=A0A4Z2I862_9TELE|nr:hypothetical protein EYF80_016312 [Liparis tanakae]